MEKPIRKSPKERSFAASAALCLLCLSTCFLCLSTMYHHARTTDHDCPSSCFLANASVDATIKEEPDVEAPDDDDDEDDEEDDEGDDDDEGNKKK